MTFIRYIGVDFIFGFLDCVRYNEDFVISRFCSIHFTVTLARLKNIVRYTEDFVIGHQTFETSPWGFIYFYSPREGLIGGRGGGGGDKKNFYINCL